MAQLLDDLGDLWDIVLDLLTFYHECCIYCQPYEDGEPVWLSEEESIPEVVQELVIGVCEANGHPVPEDINDDLVAEAFDESPRSCRNCGAQWDSLTPIGGEWLVARGHDTPEATYLLTKAYWSYLTHYTKPTQESSGLDVLLRIVWDRRIRASNRMVAGRHSVVAFTECSPLEILELLKAEGNPDPAEGFRWRRSKHGIAITRETLCAIGALPVIHGDQPIYDCLPHDQRFRFVRFDRRHAFSDWTFEREFRVEGDVDLTQLKPNDVILIVESRAEMFRILAQRKVVPFPVMPFDYVFSTDAPNARMTERQAAVEGYFPDI